MGVSRAFKFSRGIANRPPTKGSLLAKVFNYIRDAAILNASSKILPSPLALHSLSLSPRLTRSEQSSEGKLINYESYFSIQ